jgi:hypothetical protein
MTRFGFKRITPKMETRGAFMKLSESGEGTAEPRWILVND